MGAVLSFSRHWRLEMVTQKLYFVICCWISFKCILTFAGASLCASKYETTADTNMKWRKECTDENYCRRLTCRPQVDFTPESTMSSGATDIFVSLSNCGKALVQRTVRTGNNRITVEEWVRERSASLPTWEYVVISCSQIGQFSFI